MTLEVELGQLGIDLLQNLKEPENGQKQRNILIFVGIYKHPILIPHFILNELN